MSWALVITLVAVAGSGYKDQTQTIAQPNGPACLEAKATFLKRFPRHNNPNYTPTAKCVLKQAGSK